MGSQIQQVAVMMPSECLISTWIWRQWIPEAHRNKKESQFLWLLVLRAQQKPFFPLLGLFFNLKELKCLKKATQIQTSLQMKLLCQETRLNRVKNHKPTLFLGEISAMESPKPQKWTALTEEVVYFQWQIKMDEHLCGILITGYSPTPSQSPSKKTQHPTIGIDFSSSLDLAMNSVNKAVQKRETSPAKPQNFEKRSPRLQSASISL